MTDATASMIFFENVLNNTQSVKLTCLKLFNVYSYVKKSL